MESTRFSLNGEDVKKIITNFIIFAAPDFIIFLGALAAKFSAEGLLVAFLITNIVIDALRKFIAGHPAK